MLEVRGIVILLPIIGCGQLLACDSLACCACSTINRREFASNHHRVANRLKIAVDVPGNEQQSCVIVVLLGSTPVFCTICQGTPHRSEYYVSMCYCTRILRALNEVLCFSVMTLFTQHRILVAQTILNARCNLTLMSNIQ